MSTDPFVSEMPAITTFNFDAEEASCWTEVQQILPPGDYRIQGDQLARVPPPWFTPLWAFGTVSFLASEFGGRRESTPLGHFRCLIKIDSGYLDCQLEYDDDRTISPGEVANVRIRMLDLGLLRHLQPGSTFTIWDGRPIASLTIIALA